MTESPADILPKIQAKAQVLAERFLLVKNQRDEARSQCADLEQEIYRLKSRLQEAQTEIEFLKISHKIAPSEQDTRQAQELMESLVKRIDKCIKRLEKD